MGGSGAAASCAFAPGATAGMELSADRRSPALSATRRVAVADAAAGPDVKAIRAKTRLSQAKFADKLRVPVATVRDWEQHRRSPDAPARTLLGMVDADPKAALALIARMGG